MLRISWMSLIKEITENQYVKLFQLGKFNHKAISIEKSLMSLKLWCEKPV